MTKLKSTFLFHSGVMVETEEAQLFFDVFFDSVVTPDAIKALINPNKSVLFFASHGHHDHYNSIIFDVVKGLAPDKCTFILSDDIAWDAPMDGHEVRFVKSGGHYCIAGATNHEINIKTFDSTDLGVAFHVDLGGCRIFHSGDLNWWHWENTTPDIQLEEARAFKSIMDLVVREKINLAFVPLDPRLSSAAPYAFEYFLDASSATHVVPIHFGEQFDTLKKICDENQTIEAFKDAQRVIIPTGKLERLI